MTIPNITSQYRKISVETRLANLYTIIKQAKKRSEVDNESVEYLGKLFESDQMKDNDGNIIPDMYSSNTLEWYNRYLTSYLKSLRVMVVNTQGQRLLVCFTDRSLLNFSSRSFFYPDAPFYEEEEKDNSLNDRKPQDSGKRYFTFQFYPLKF